MIRIKRRKATPEIIEKTCSKCGETKPVEEFHRYVGPNARSRDGYRAQCKECRNAAERGRRTGYWKDHDTHKG